MSVPCSQCGQRLPVCAVCGDQIIVISRMVPRTGFGQSGDRTSLEWRHVEPPRADVDIHDPVPRVFVA